MFIPILQLWALVAVAGAVCFEQVMHNLNNVTALSADLNDQIVSFEHSFVSDALSLLRLQKTAMALGDLVEETTENIYHHTNFTATQAISVAGVVLELKTPILATLDALDEKKPEFERAILNFVSVALLIKIDIETLRGGVLDLTGALLARMPQLYSAALRNESARLVARMNATLELYEEAPLIVDRKGNSKPASLRKNVHIQHH